MSLCGHESRWTGEHLGHWRRRYTRSLWKGPLASHIGILVSTIDHALGSPDSRRNDPLFPNPKTAGIRSQDGIRPEHHDYAGRNQQANTVSGAAGPVTSLRRYPKFRVQPTRSTPMRHTPPPPPIFQGGWVSIGRLSAHVNGSDILAILSSDETTTTQE